MFTEGHATPTFAVITRIVAYRLTRPHEEAQTASGIVFYRQG